MNELLQTMLGAFQRLTELNLPLFSWYRHVLNHPDRLWFLLGAFGIGCMLGFGFKLYREHHLERYSIFDGFPFMLIPVLIGGLSVVLVYLLIVPLLYVAVLAVILFIVWDGIEQFHAAVRPVVCWNALGVLGSLLILSTSGYIVWFFVRHWSIVVGNWSVEKTVWLIVCILLVSVLFGLLRHHYYRDKSKLVSSSYLGTTFRYLHINPFWAVWRVFYDFAVTISERNTAGQVALVAQQSELVVDVYKFQLDMANEDLEQSAEQAEKQSDALHRQLNGYKRELHRVREENKTLNDKVVELSAAVMTLNEQNGELHQQWVDALQSTGVIDEGVIDLDELFTDED